MDQNKVTTNTTKNKQYYIAICTCIKDEYDIKEWISYHVILGFNHIYIYDNNIKTSLAKELEPFAPYVTVIANWSTKDNRHQSFQVAAYNDFIALFKKEVEWVAFIDGDEYIALKQHDNINELLPVTRKKPVAMDPIWFLFDLGILDF